MTKNLLPDGVWILLVLVGLVAWYHLLIWLPTGFIRAPAYDPTAFPVRTAVPLCLADAPDCARLIDSVIERYDTLEVR